MEQNPSGERVANNMAEFFEHARGTGGGSPLLPPDDVADEDTDGDGFDDETEDVNFIPSSVPETMYANYVATKNCEQFNHLWP